MKFFVLTHDSRMGSDCCLCLILIFLNSRIWKLAIIAPRSAKNTPTVLVLVKRSDPAATLNRYAKRAPEFEMMVLLLTLWVGFAQTQHQTHRGQCGNTVGDRKLHVIVHMGGVWKYDEQEQFRHACPRNVFVEVFRGARERTLAWKQKFVCVTSRRCGVGGVGGMARNQEKRPTPNPRWEHRWGLSPRKSVQQVRQALCARGKHRQW